MPNGDQTTAADFRWAEGFSRAELLRRAQIFYDLAAARDRDPRQRQIDIRLAQRHEDAANHAR